MKLRNVIFPRPEDAEASSPPTLWDVSLVDGVVESIAPAAGETESEDEGGGGGVASRLLLPPLCHPHLHLDKAYLLTSGCCGGGGGASDPDYADLLPQTGSFAEALQTTAVAKSRFTAADLRRRGLQLLATSAAQGVASARVFVEVDAQAAGRGRVAVGVARELRAVFRGTLALQVCAFAQEVLFTGAAGDANRAAMEAVLEANREESDATVAVLGVTPYVEATRAQALQNIEWAVAAALKYDLHLDLHLDYNLKDYAGDGTDEDNENEPLIFTLLEALVRHDWRGRQRTRTRTVVVGHATQLTRLPPAQLERLADAIRAAELPVYLVGLPTSDLYMMGRTEDGAPAPRGTLPVPALVRRFGLRACLGVNNIGNAFTPHGTGDPLQLACWGVGLYHAGTGPDARLLYGSVSWRAREAIGMGEEDDEEGGDSRRVDWEQVEPSNLAGARIGRVLVVANRRYIPLSLPPGTTPDGSTALGRIPARPRSSFRDVVWDPPDVSLRRVA